jgi:hypothetical protein
MPQRPTTPGQPGLIYVFRHIYIDSVCVRAFLQMRMSNFNYVIRYERNAGVKLKRFQRDAMQCSAVQCSEVQCRAVQ